MTTRRRRSRKRSDGRARRRRRPDPTFLIDHCLGRHDVADALRSAGAARIVLLADVFPADTDDDVWLAAAGRRRWVVLTKDRHFRKRRLELLAVINAKVRVFALSSAGLSSSQQASAFATALPKIRRVCHQQRALIATVTTSGAVTVATPADLRRWLGSARESPAADL